MRKLARLSVIGLMISGVAAVDAAAQTRPVLLRDSFPVGSGDGILCQAQDRSLANPARQSMFDRNWAVICRDSARPVAQIYAFDDASVDSSSLVAPHRREAVDCSGAAGVDVADISGATRTECRVPDSELTWSVYQFTHSGKRFHAEGFSAYDTATELALRSLIANEVVEGTIDIATTTVTDQFAFARIQAETLEPGQALAEGYRRNLGGEYAEAAAYFEALQDRLTPEEAREARINPGEFLVNRALQKSNLGDFAEAERLFEQASELTAGDPIAARLQRNFEAIHLLNRLDYARAVLRLEQPLDIDLRDAESLSERLQISRPISERLNASEDSVGLLGFVDELKLTDEERAEIIDAQALQLTGTAQRLLGQNTEARAALLDAYNRAIAVRDGRVTSITRLRAQVLAELALIAERAGDVGTANTYLRNAIAILEAQYPERRAVSSARARLAGLLLRHDQEGEANELYRRVVMDAVGKSEAATGFSNQLEPYFRFLAPQVEGDGTAAEDFFRATQVLVRPGVAETQAILARELSARSDDAARLFRQSVDLTRDIERNRIRLTALSKMEQTRQVMLARNELSERLERLEGEQLRTQSQLADFPEYRVVQPSALSLGDFRAVLQPGEAYARLATVGGELFMFYTDASTSKAWQLDMDEGELDVLVDDLRASISVFEDGQYVTYPYDIELARELFKRLFEPVAGEIAASEHLIFEPDAAMLRLPIDILVADDASVAAYVERVDVNEGDPYDFTGVRWLASDTQVSTAVSAQAFVDARRAAPSDASREYLGVGGNTPLGDSPPPEISVKLASGSNQCGWAVDQWNAPIDTAELTVASQIIGEGRSQLFTGDEFTDERLTQMDDIDEYRVIHFATHGLVTPPAPPCPARPALLTSFGSGDSDGLLSFQEIFDLDLDADIVILSACDTAGKASIQATREAGVGTGGGTALDGLVRSFIGAGGRSVMASHWPAPDDFQATQRLMNEMFRSGQSADLGTALRQSQQMLMADSRTSHPYYWGGFSVIGDVARPLLSPRETVAQVTDEAVSGGQ